MQRSTTEQNLYNDPIKLELQEEGLLFLKMNFDEKRLRKDEKLMKKYYFLQEDFTVSGKQAQINFSLQGDYIEFKCKSRINPCTVISDNVDLQLKRGDVLLIQYPCGKKIHFGVHQSSTVECTKFGMLYTQEVEII